jgi:hypothetical protein
MCATAARDPIIHAMAVSGKCQDFEKNRYQLLKKCGKYGDVLRFVNEYCFDKS